MMKWVDWLFAVSCLIVETAVAVLVQWYYTVLMTAVHCLCAFVFHCVVCACFHSCFNRWLYVFWAFVLFCMSVQAVCFATVVLNNAMCQLLYNACLKVVPMHVRSSDVNGYFITAYYFIEIVASYHMYLWQHSACYWHSVYFEPLIVNWERFQWGCKHHEY